MSAPRELTLLGHLRELRRRLVYSAIAIGLAMIPGFFLSTYLLMLLKDLAPGVELIFTGATEMLNAYMRISIYAGLAIALPFLALQVFAFVSPALTFREKRYVFALLPGIVLFFLAGVAFSYFVLLPPALKFLLTFGTDIARPFLKISDFVSLVTRLMFWTGVVFEIPVIMYFLGKIGIVSHRTLGRYRKIAFLGAFVLGAMITPTVDPVNQALISLPVYGLYETGIWLAWLARRDSKTRHSITPSGK